VAFVPKTGHQQEHRIFGASNCIAVNKKKGPTLILRRGRTYCFTVQQTAQADGSFAHSLYFTQDCLGGLNLKGQQADDPNWSPAKIAGTPDPVTNGTFLFKVDKSTPRTFYYQSAHDFAMGGLCLVYDH
jgi:hypothetical protein